MSGIKPATETLCKNLEEWARTKKRVTCRDLMNSFMVDRETADTYYAYLKSTGIVGSMGYVGLGGAKNEQMD